MESLLPCSAPLILLQAAGLKKRFCQRKWSNGPIRIKQAKDFASALQSFSERFRLLLDLRRNFIYFHSSIHKHEHINEKMKGQDHEQAFWIEDGALVGSAAILNPSPRVNTDPMVNRPVPVPSIFRDARGSIHNL
jgi:hypothetical protein